MKRVAVLISGRGSNLGALLAHPSPSASIALTISNRTDAPGLDVARRAGVEALAIPHAGRERQDHEREVLAALNSRSVEIVCLAGYMRVLTATFVDTFPGPILNIHPSLLPAFPGARAQKQAIEAGVRWTGVTVHLVDAGLDSGPILLQEPVPVLPDDTEETLSARMLVIEHRLYPQALDIVASGGYERLGRRVVLKRFLSAS